MNLQPGTRIEALYMGTLHTATVVDVNPDTPLLYALVDLDIALQTLLQRGSMSGTRALIARDNIVTVFEE